MQAVFRASPWLRSGLLQVLLLAQVRSSVDRTGPETWVLAHRAFDSLEHVPVRSHACAQRVPVGLFGIDGGLLGDVDGPSEVEEMLYVCGDIRVLHLVSQVVMHKLALVYHQDWNLPMATSTWAAAGQAQ